MARRKMVKFVKRAGSSLARRVREERDAVAAVAASAAFGYMGRDTELPTFGGLSPEASWGIGAYLVSRTTGSKIARAVATGLLCVAAHQFAREQGGGGEGGGGASGGT